ncbi:MAG TPA: tyrosinase family protein [Sphingomonas sp.]|nr:tyrosinase family protein [Sphingomonas sp.]
MITRRETLHRVALGGAAIFVGAIPGTRAFAAPPVVRKEINGYALNDPMIQTLRDGVKLLKARAPGSPNWTDMSNIHGTAAGFNKCPHGNWYFLPWHRAYLLMYERMIRSVTGNAGFAMPYWDWTAHPTVPQAFAQATYNGQPNPLYVAARNNGYSIPTIYSGTTVMNNIYGQTNFELFGSSRRPGQNSLDPSWIKGPGTQGTLEATPHNNIHTHLGGFMPNGNSPMDPIFLMHHGNIDRIWWSWNCRGHANTTDPLWLNMPFTNNYYDTNGSWLTYKPSQLLNIGTLGYSYGLCLRRIPHLPIWVLANARLTEIFKAGSALAAHPAGAQVLRLQQNARGRSLDAVGAAPPAAVRNLFLNRTKSLAVTPQLKAEQRTSQIVALIHDLTPMDDQVEILVFAGGDDMPANAGTDDPHFVTSIGFFGAHAHGGGGMSASVDLTDHLRGLNLRSDKVQLRLVARPIGGEGDAMTADAVARAKVEIVIV